jgi:hypothetical protein
MEKHGIFLGHDAARTEISIGCITKQHRESGGRIDGAERFGATVENIGIGNEWLPRCLTVTNGETVENFRGDERQIAGKDEPCGGRLLAKRREYAAERTFGVTRIPQHRNSLPTLGHGLSFTQRNVCAPAESLKQTPRAARLR